MKIKWDGESACNPVFLYEIRQIVRNRSIQNALLFFLLFLLGVVGVDYFELIEGIGTRPLERLASALCTRILILLFSFTLILVLLYSIITAVNQEREGDMFRTAPLDWTQVMKGKLIAAAVLSSLFYCTALPFLTLVWMMRGIDLFHLGNLLCTMFLFTQTVNFYVNASLVHYRRIDILIMVFCALVLASPPWIAYFFISFAILHEVFNYRFDGVSLFFFYVFQIITTGILWFVSVKLFQMNWKPIEGDYRFVVVLVWAWSGAVIILIACVCVFAVIGTIGAILGF